MRLDADVGLPVLQDQHPDNDTLCLHGADLRLYPRVDGET